LAYMSFPREHWIKIRTTNPLERINREIRRRTRVVGAFPDGNAAVLLVTARRLRLRRGPCFHFFPWFADPFRQPASSIQGLKKKVIAKMSLLIT
jgi:hypothetical protein